MALDLGELTIRLELENDAHRGIAAAKTELQSLSPTAQREMVKVSRVFREEGDKSGNLLAQGVRSGFIRNSPLIAAAVAGGLTAGAPLMLAAAGALFGGVGAVAAAQTGEVRSAWSNLGRDIRDGAVQDAAVLVPVYVEMADKIGGAFSKMRPELREAFADSAPLIRSFTDGVIALGENAMPGLLRAVSAGKPVFEGLEHFLSVTGRGLTEFFDAMSAHSPAAGEAFASLGDIVGELLPLLGELLGHGAELASIVLPPLASVLGLVTDAASALGPALPPIVMAITALKVAQAATTWVTGLGDAFGKLVVRGQAVHGTTGKMAGAIGGLAAGMGPLGAAMAVVTAVGIGYTSMQARAADQADRLATSIRAGGDEATRVRGALAEAASQNDVFASAVDDVNEALRRQWEAMSPLEQAQSKVAEWTQTLTDRMHDESASAAEVEAAQQRLAYWTGEVEQEQSALEFAISGVTSAMLEQANQALAAIDSGFAYRNSLDQLEDAQIALSDAMANGTVEDQQRAMLALEEQAYRTAAAFGQQQADLSGLSSDSLEYKRIVQEEMLGELYRLQAAAGPEMAAAIGAQIAALQTGGVSLSASAQLTANLSGQVQGLSAQIHEVPGQKFVRIDAPTAEQKQRLADLGYQVVNLPDGDILVTADTAAANAAIDYAARRRWAVITTVTEAVGGPAGTGRGVPERAAGGPVWPGQTFLVGEQGPELVRFAGRGEVIPADQTAAMARGSASAPSAASPVSMGGGGTTNISVVAHTADERRIAAAISRRQQDAAYLAGVR